jgi:hypothetical protein
MSRFTFGFLLGAGAGWAVGSGKAAEWKRTIEERRAVDVARLDQPSGLGPRAVTDPFNGIAPTTAEVAAL